MTRRAQRVLAALGVSVLLWAARLVWDYYDPTSVAHQAMRYQLQQFGAAIYEYHSTTGRWPTSLDDLAQTSLPARSHVWRQTATTMVFLWPTSLKPDAKDNKDILLAYDNAGLFNKLGRVWVCWGDLRTELMNEQVLRARIRK